MAAIGLKPASGPMTDLNRTAPRPTRPVLAWAALGVAFLALEVWIYGGWITSGNMTATPAGPTPVPDWMKVVTRGWEIFSVVAGVIAIHRLLIRPWRRAGRITADGLMLAAFMTLYWQDPLVNYFMPWCTYNASMINFGSWAANVPGLVPPNMNLFAEPLVFAAPFYAWVLFPGVLIANRLMAKVRERRPQTSSFALVMGCIAFFVAFDCIMEPFFLMMGIYSYPGAIRSLSLFAGHYYQFPIYEGVIWGVLWALWACLRFFKDDHGNTFVERGIGQVPGSERKRSVVRFLALVGVLNALYLGVYTGPAAVWGAHSDPWPEDVMKRSYFLDGICGPGTTYACPSPDIPNPRRNSARVGPDGTLVVPEGVELP